MCFFRRKSKRKAAAAAAAASEPVVATDSSQPPAASSERLPDVSRSALSAVPPAAAHAVGAAGTEAVAPAGGGEVAVPEAKDVLVVERQSAGEGPSDPEVAEPSGPSVGTRPNDGGATGLMDELAGRDQKPGLGDAVTTADADDAAGIATVESGEAADAVDEPAGQGAAGDGAGVDAGDGTLEGAAHGERRETRPAREGQLASTDMAPALQRPTPGAPRDEVWGQDGADGKRTVVLSELIEAVTRPADSGAADEVSTGDGAGSVDGAPGRTEVDGARSDQQDDEAEGRPLPSGEHAGVQDGAESAASPAETMNGEGSESTPGGAVVETTADTTTESDAMPITATSAPEETPTPAATDEEWPPTAVDPDDPDLMEAPSNRPVPEDAIRRASEALDAAVNAAPAVIGPLAADVGMDEDEVVAYVDGEFTHSDRETEVEAEPDDVASDYSGRVTDPIPVQSLSAPGVSRETSGTAPTAHGTQQPTGGPHGSDDERRSALIATVPAVDDTTPVAAELAMDARRRIELQGRKFPRPPKTRIITVANQKGGVGKTTTTVNIAAGLAQSGLNVLVIDNDPQGNASTALGIEHRAGTPSVYEILVEGESLASTVQPCPDIPNLWGVPATIDLSGSEIELVSLVSRETRLRKAIDKYLADRVAAGEERIDYVLIDCPPSLGLLTVNAFVAGREVFIPIQCEYYALEGLSQLLKTIDLIRSHLNPELRVSSILLTMYDGRTNLAQQVAGEVRSHFPAETFKTTIPRSVRISEAPSYGQTVMTYDATSTGALAYLQASRELAERGQGGSSPRRAMKAETVGAQD